MDTKSTSFSYSTGVKAIALILAWVSFTVAALCGTFLVYHLTFPRLQSEADWALVIGSSSLALLLLSAVFLVFTAGRKGKREPIAYRRVDRIYTDVHTLMVLGAAAASFTVMANIGFFPGGWNFWIAFGVILFMDAMIGSSYILSMARQIKGKQVLTNSLIGKAWQGLWSFCRIGFKGVSAFNELCFQGNRFWIGFSLALLGLVAVNDILVLLLINAVNWMSRSSGFLYIILLAGFNLFALAVMSRWAVSLSRIMKAAQEISGGNPGYPLDMKNIPIAFSGFANDIQNIQGGLRSAMAEAIRGERMKTDLITNVSHDLKTPLTSIVSYVDLLKKEDLQNEQAVGYVKVLEEKSARLKQLIEDLVEASKASSGNVTVVEETLDLSQLAQQACGEYEEKMSAAGLEIRIRAEEEKTLVRADGKHLWRILENLMGNVLKYAQPQTRVYIYASAVNSFGVLTIKNVSAFPLNITPEQLTERFVRGDAARSTEGSGLGLSIAQSLTVLQGGQFKIEIDGDLFKISVGFPLANAGFPLENQAVGFPLAGNPDNQV